MHGKLTVHSACVASVLRTYFMFIAVNSTDYTWYSYLAWAWNVVEINLATTCPSIPFLRPIVNHLPCLDLAHSRPHSRCTNSRYSWNWNWRLRLSTNGAHGRVRPHSKGSISQPFNFVHVCGAEKGEASLPLPV